MNRAPSPSLVSGPLLVSGMIVLAALSRLLPHPPNFSPVEAIALFGAAWFAKRSAAIWVPLAAMLLSDIALGLVNGGVYSSYFFSLSFLLVYACIALTALLGFGLRGRASVLRVGAFSLLGSGLFFLVTNFGTWLGSPMYAQDAGGLIAAYIAGLPFLKYTVLGTLFYAALLFGAMAWLRRRHPALVAQTA